MQVTTKEKHSTTYTYVNGKSVSHDIMVDVTFDVVVLNGVLGAINLGVPHDFGGIRQERAWRIIDLTSGNTVAPISTKGNLKHFVRLWNDMRFTRVDDDTYTDETGMYTIKSLKKYEIIED